MRTVNADEQGSDLRIVDFWEQTYLPFVKENMKVSTVTGYEQIWKQHLKTHFAKMTLAEYRTAKASAFLLGLTKTQGRATLNHVRSLMSGIFSHAVNLGLLAVNPMTGCKILGKVRPPAATSWYTLEEAENIISALVARVDAQLVISLAFFAGLRPSEIQGLQWSDFSLSNDGTGTVSIRRAVVRGVVGTCKTPESVATLPLLPQIVVPLCLWKEQCVRAGLGTQKWLFENGRGMPADLREMIRRVVRPACEKAGLVWKGLYAGRRGAATAIIGLTNNVAAAQELLRHKNMGTTLAFYKKQTADALLAGLRALGAAAGTVGGKE
jgi:integrase